ncbi:MAG: prepilin-type N-terminal cleavage/methylation domain-containing protein [Clostridiaceae bacterium]|nr:prepilin-type N-terminal cleavage/methylation domain-containing protein [Clostridiaceae bacterium]
MKKNNKGFSLVELIIVIAIMAVLVAVLAPQYIKYVEKSRESKDLAALDEILRAAQTAAVDPSITPVAGSIAVTVTGDKITLVATTTNILTTMVANLGTTIDGDGVTGIAMASTKGKAVSLTINVDLTAGVKWATAPSFA